MKINISIAATRQLNKTKTRLYCLAGKIENHRVRSNMKGLFELVKAPADTDSLYSYVEPEIRTEWAEGGQDHLNGDIQGAVRRWSIAMKKQSELARSRYGNDSVRLFEGVWLCAIGHIALLAIFAKANLLGLFNAKRMVIAANFKTPNDCYLSYFEDLFEIIRTPEQISTLDSHFRTELPGVLKIGGRWVYLNSAIGMVRQRWSDENRPPLLRLRHDHQRMGRELLTSLGVPADAWWVAVHVREGGRISGGFDLGSIRNSNILDYVEAIQAITDAGGWVIRIGGKDFTQLPKMHHVIDCAVDIDHEDWIDVFVLGGARFMIATNSGPAWVADSFGVPILFTNWAPTAVDPFWSDSRVLKKKLYKTNILGGRTEIVDSKDPLCNIESLHALLQSGVEVEQNNSMQLASAVDRMLKQFSS